MSASLTYTITADTADAQKQLAELVRAFQSVKKEGDLGSVGRGAAAGISGVDKLKGSVGGLLAALGSVAAAAAGVGFALKKGLDANASAESAQLGIKAIVASLYDMRDANGQLLQGTDALAVAGSEADKQLQLLRVAGMNTAASFEELSSAFQVALGTGAGAGLGIDQIRTLTVDLVQAASAFSLQGDQLNSEVRAILSGEQIDNSQIAQGLGLTGAQIKLWREQGTLVENLNERLTVFRQIGDEAGKTWTATLSNLGDGVQTFLRQTTAGAFDGIKTALQDALASAIDPATGNIQPAFDGLAALATQVFTDIGAGIADMIDGAVDLAQEFSGWLERNRETVASTYAAFQNVFAAIGDVVANIAQAVGMTAKASAEAGLLRTVFNTVALTIALAADGVKMLAGTLAAVGGTVVAVLVQPLKFVAQVIDSITGSKLASYADTIQAAAIKSAKFGVEMAKAGAAVETFRKTEARIQAQGVAAIVKPEVGAPAAAAPTRAGTVVNRARQKAEADDKASKRAADKSAREAEAQARKDAAALDALNKSLADYSRAQAAALREKALAELDADLQKQLISQQDYLQRKADIERAALDEETRIANARIDELQKVADDEKLAKDERLKAAAEIVKVRGELLAIDGKKAVIGIRLDAESDAVRKYLKDLGADLQAQLQELAGDSAGAARARLATETAKMLEDPRVKGSSEIQALIERVREAKAAIIELDEATRLVSVVNDELSAKETAINAERERGFVTELDAQKQVRQARLDAAAAMLPSVEAAEKLAAITGDPARIKEAQDMRTAYTDLAKTMDELAVSLDNTFFDGIKRGFRELTREGKSFGDVMRSIITDVLAQLADVLFKNALEGFAAQYLGGVGGAGGLGSWLSKVFTGRAVGGAVHDGGAYIVGERGPEVMFPGSAGTIIPTSRLQSALADMLGISARRAPTPAFAPVAGPVMGGGSTNVSVSPTVVISALDTLNAIAQLPAFADRVTAVVAGRGQRIQAAWR